VRSCNAEVKMVIFGNIFATYIKQIWFHKSVPRYIVLGMSRGEHKFVLKHDIYLTQIHTKSMRIKFQRTALQY
jgi:hypothetical protein